MKVYAPLTVDALIGLLDGMEPDAPIRGLEPESGSYRGYYEHVYVSPGGGTTAAELRDHLRSRLDSHMEGYKGGDFTFESSCYVFVAKYGDTGYSLAGFTDEGEPIVLEEAWF